MDLVEGFEMSSALSQPSPARSSAFFWDMEAHSAVSSTPSEGPVLMLSSSEVLDVLSIKAGGIEDLPPPSPSYEEPVEVITGAVAKLNITWLVVKVILTNASCQIKQNLYIGAFHFLLTSSPRNGSWNKPFSNHAHQVVQNNFNLGGQGLYAGRLGWGVSAHNVNSAGIPSQPAKGP